MKNFLLGFVAAIVLLPACAAAYFRLGFADVQADTRPAAWESGVMRNAVRNSVTRRAEGRVAPTAGNDRLVAGGKLYMNGCAGCHGQLGKPFQEDRSGYPPAPQLPHVGTQYTEPQIYWIVKHGVRMTAMSAYGRFYSEEQLWLIAAFLHNIRSLPPEVQDRILAKSADTKP